jgi:hypothetical protein
MIKKITLIGVLLTILLATIISADVNMVEWAERYGHDVDNYICAIDEDCQCDPNWSGFCYCQKGDCYWARENVDSNTTTIQTNQTTTTTQGRTSTALTGQAATTAVTGGVNVLALSNTVKQLQSTITQLQQQLNTIQQSNSNLKTETTTQIQQINNQLSSEINNIENSLKTDLNKALTGQATLQSDLNETKTSLQEVEEYVQDRKKIMTILTTVFLILLVIAVTLGTIYYINRKGKFRSALPKDVTDYITKEIQGGKKYPQIKADLIRIGWDEEDVKWAYRETIKNNYKSYLKKKSLSKVNAKVSSTNQKKKSPDKKKILIISFVTIFIIIMMVLILNTTVGEAIFYEKTVGGESNGTSGVVGYTFECTPPHILTSSKDGCCLDRDNNAVCDNVDGRNVAKLGSGAACFDNQQCINDEYCIEGACQTLNSLYTSTGDCSKKCDVYAAKIVTSDSEIYNVAPNKGSYTAAGALEWKLLPTPQHCKGEEPVLAINIIRKDLTVINENVIALKQNEMSDILDPEIAFTISVERIFQSCPE